MSAASLSVSVIIPAFNSARWIREAIDSVLQQSVRPLEIIVIDDGSTDETPAVLATYGPRIRCVRQANAGVAAARNAGLCIARGPFVAFLDADDVWHPRKLELQLAVMQSNPGVALLGTELTAWPGSLPDVPPGAVPPVRSISRDAMAVRNHLTTSSILLRREIAECVGSFDTQLSGPEDHDYWLRVAEVAPVAILPLPLTGYRCVPGSLSKRAGAMEAGMHRILGKLDERGFWGDDRWLRRRAYSFANYSAAYLHGTAGDQWRAISRLLRSVFWYPLPARADEIGSACSRTRRLAVVLLRLLRLKPLDRGY